MSSYGECTPCQGTTVPHCERAPRLLFTQYWFLHSSVGTLLEERVVEETTWALLVSMRTERDDHRINATWV